MRYTAPKPRTQGAGVTCPYGWPMHETTGFDKFVAECSDRLREQYKANLDAVKNKDATMKRILEGEWKALPEAEFIRFYDLSKGVGAWARDEAARKAARKAQLESFADVEYTRAVIAARERAHEQVKTHMSYSNKLHIDAHGAYEEEVVDMVRRELRRARDASDKANEERLAKRARASEDSQ